MTDYDPNRDMTEERYKELFTALCIVEGECMNIFDRDAVEMAVEPNFTGIDPAHLLEALSRHFDEPFISGVELSTTELAFIQSIPDSGLPPKHEMKWRWQRGGGHIHVRVFTRTPPTSAWAGCGTLTFTVGEWQHVKTHLTDDVLVEEA